MSNVLQTHHIRATLTQDGTLTLDELPFQAGETVEIIVRPRLAAPEVTSDPADRYPLRGLVVSYDRPTDPVALEDWDALR